MTRLLGVLQKFASMKHVKGFDSRYNAMCPQASLIIALFIDALQAGDAHRSLVVKSFSCSCQNQTPGAPAKTLERLRLVNMPSLTSTAASPPATITLIVTSKH